MANELKTRLGVAELEALERGSSQRRAAAAETQRLRDAITAERIAGEA